MPACNPTNNALLRLARAESAFLATEFLAPVVYGRAVMLNIAEVRFTLRVIPADYRGWGIFRPLSHNCAQVVRLPSAEQRREYLELFPAIRLIVLTRTADAVSAIAANAADLRFDTSAPFSVNLAFGCDVFDTIVARFDGCQFWFDRVDERVDPFAGAYLRRALAMSLDPAQFDRSGLTDAHRRAYAARCGHGTKTPRDRGAARVRDGLADFSVGMCLS